MKRKSGAEAIEEYERWKTVVDSGGDSTLYSIRVPGGWLYLYERFGVEEEAGTTTSAMTFVPDWFDPVKTEAAEYLKQIAETLGKAK